MIVEFLKKVVIDANKIIKDEFIIKEKGSDYDLITEFDYKVEKFIISKIKEKFPDFEIVSEEYNTNHKETKNCFIIDPIDGTINFANHIPLWGIQVACMKEGKIVACVIYLPKLNELYYADEKGAYLNNKKINIEQTSIKKALYVFEGKHECENSRKIIKNMYEVAKNQRVFGAMCVSYAYMASGKIHGVVFNANRPWDYEPGLFLCKMAGAKICDKDDFHAAAMNDEFLEVLEKACK